MCRLYASLGPQGPPREELQAFRGLCATGCGGPHGDGWGIVGYARTGAPHVLGKATTAALKDPAFEEAAARAAGFRVVMAHLRKASVGPKVLENTHPFSIGAWTFAHNGTIRGGYEEALAPGSGMNDSRVLFRQVHAALDKGPEDALRRAIAEVRERGYYHTSITVLLTDGATLWAARDVREREDEYTLRWRREGERLVVCQEPILPGAWEALPNRHLAVLGPAGVRVAPL